MDLHQGEQIIFQGRPSWRSIMAFHLGGLVLAVAVGVAVAVAKSTGLGVAAGVVVLLLAILVGFLRRLGTHYVLTDERLHIRRGLISKDVQETRLDRVQNVNTHQSIIERMLQIGTVDFDTSASGGYDFRFAGVAQPEKVVADVDRAQHAAAQRAAAPEAPVPAQDA